MFEADFSKEKPTVGELEAFLRGLPDDILDKPARIVWSCHYDPIVWAVQVTDELIAKKSVRPSYCIPGAVEEWYPFQFQSKGDILLLGSDDLPKDWIPEHPTFLTARDLLRFFQSLDCKKKVVTGEYGDWIGHVRQVYPRNTNSRAPKDCKPGERADPDWWDQIMWDHQSTAEPPLEVGQLLFFLDVGVP